MSGDNEVLEVKGSLMSPAQLIEKAIFSGADLGQLEKVLELQERWEAKEARKAYSRDFSQAQAEIDPVVKKATNSQTHSKYALLEGVIETAQPIYTKYGFSIIFYEGETPKPEHIRINADVLHTLGHKETYYYDVPLDGMGIKGNANMTKIHAKASSTSYARRYLMCMIWNISTTDNDGNSVASVPTISAEDVASIKKSIDEKGIDVMKLCKFLNVESLEKIPVTEYEKALKAVETAKGKNANPKA